VCSKAKYLPKSIMAIKMKTTLECSWFHPADFVHWIV
jgi:hypothetical protein